MNNELKIKNLLIANGMKWQDRKLKKFINPGRKAASSIYDKIIRLYFESDDKENFSISKSKIDDLLRMTIIVDYVDMGEVIALLKQNFRDLTGYIKMQKAGYRGIHLHLTMFGLPCEIQLTPEVVRKTMNCLHIYYASGEVLMLKKC